MSTFNTFIPSSPLSLIHATTVIDIISKWFLVSNVLSKVPSILIMVPSNCFRCKVDFLSLGFPKSCQKFTGINVMSEPVSTCMWKYFPFVFTFSLVFVSVLSVKISAPSLSTFVSLTSSTFFVSANHQGVIFSFENGACLTEGRAIIFFLIWCSPQYLHRISYLFVLYASYSFVCWLCFFINSSCCTNSIQVSTDKLTLWSVSNNLSLKAGSCIPIMKRSMINSSSVSFHRGQVFQICNI